MEIGGTGRRSGGRVEGGTERGGTASLAHHHFERSPESLLLHVAPAADRVRLLVQRCEVHCARQPMIGQCRMHMHIRVRWERLFARRRCAQRLCAREFGGASVVTYQRAHKRRSPGGYAGIAAAQRASCREGQDASPPATHERR